MISCYQHADIEHWQSFIATHNANIAPYVHCLLVKTCLVTVWVEAENNCEVCQVHKTL